MNMWVKASPAKRNAVSVRRMQALDRKAIFQFGIPAPVLMDHAGRGVAEVALKILGRGKGRVIVLCGKGNNGGDGFVAARYLWLQGVRVEIWMASSSRALSKDARLYHHTARKLGVPIFTLRSAHVPPHLAARASRAGLIIDALLGTGLSRKVREPHRGLIGWMNGTRRKILAVDTPSGLNADRGNILGCAVEAYATATCGFPKRGFFRNEGPRHVGRLFVIDIGLPVRG